MPVKLEWLATVWWKNYDDTLSRFHTIPACHGQTDRIAISVSRVSSSMLTRDKNRMLEKFRNFSVPEEFYKRYQKPTTFHFVISTPILQLWIVFLRTRYLCSYSKYKNKSKNNFKIWVPKICLDKIGIIINDYSYLRHQHFHSVLLADASYIQSFR